MNIGRAITEGMRADRRRDLERATTSLDYWGLSIDDQHRLLAWCWWGWSIAGRGGLGRPGL